MAHARTWAATPQGHIWLDAAWVWALTRALFLLLTFLAPALLLPHGLVGGANVALDRWVTQDGFHFAAIAQHGYVPSWRTAFWPLFPLAMHLLGPIFGGDYGLAGMAIANAAFFAALVLLRGLGERELGAAAARRAIRYLALFPTAFYFFAPYSEALFLALSIGTFVALRQRRWWLAGVLAGAATLTRSAGVLLLLPFAVEFARALGVSYVAGSVRLRRAQPGELAVARWWQGAWALLIPGAVALYSGYLYLRFGDALAYAHAQAYWGRSLQWPWTTFFLGIGGLGHTSSASGFGATHLLLNLAALLAFVALALLALRVLPLSYGLYALALVVYVSIFPARNPVAAVQGEGRLVLMLFPVFLALGHWGRRTRLHEALLLASPALLTLACAHYLVVLGG